MATVTTSQIRRRRHPRRMVAGPGWVLYGAGLSTRHPCTIEDSSVEGARLSFSPAQAGVPDRFILIDVSARKVGLATVVWRHELSVGVGVKRSADPFEDDLWAIPKMEGLLAQL